MARSTRLIFLVLLLLSAFPVAAQTGSGCATPLSLVPGQPVFTRPGIFIRNTPTISGAQVDYYNKSMTLKVVSGPVCADGMNWWQVTVPLPGNPGWVSEGTPDFILLFPDTKFDSGQNCPASLGFTPGASATLLGGTHLRDKPTKTGLSLTVLPTNSTVEILGGPTCAEDINWWNVRAFYPGSKSTSTVDGWLAEGLGSDIFLSNGAASAAPTTPENCSPVYYRLSVGIRAVITYDDSKPKNLRAAPGLDSPSLTTLLKGIEVDIIGGPTCKDQLNWWQLQVVGQPNLVGWLAEGGRASNQWLRPLIYN